MTFIYVLQLELNKYYVGKTNDPETKFDFHFSSCGSAWTKTFKPINICEFISERDPYEEDIYTLKYMEKYGIDNVRGGSFCTIELSEEQIKLINQMIKGSTNKCYNCKESGHFIKDCFKLKIQEFINDINDKNIENKIITINLIHEEIIELNNLIRSTCSICMDDLPEIKKEFQNSIELYKLQNENNEIQKKLHKDKDKNNKHHCAEKIRLNNSQINELNNLKSHGRNYSCCIDGCYNNIFGKKHMNKDIVIKSLELIKFNFEKKRRLKEIYNEYHNENFVRELLLKLYEKNIEMIQLQISKK